MKHKKMNSYIFPLILYAVVNLIFFSISYFNIRSLAILMGQHVILLANIFVSLIVVRNIKTTIARKVLFVLASSIVGTVVGFLLVLATMVLPGSREHNHVMYDICLPAMKKYYGLNTNDPWPEEDRVDKEGFGKWWYQHSECEQNVWNGNGPIFSEDPPNFIPITK